MHCVQFFLPYNAQHSRGACSPRKMFKFRPYESASEAIGDHHWTVTQAIHRMVISRSPFPSESAFVYEALPQNCLLGAAYLSACMFAGHEVVIHIEMCTVLEWLRVLSAQ